MSKKTDPIAALFAAVANVRPEAERYGPEEDYGAFLARHTPSAAVLAAQGQAELYTMPRFLIQLFPGGNEKDLAATRASLEGQSYANWQIAGSAEEDFDFVLFLEAGDTLLPDALFCFAEAMNAAPGAELFYADEDVRLPGGERGEPICKPEYGEATQLSYNMIGRPMAAAKALYARAGGMVAADAERSIPAAEYDYTLRCIAKGGEVIHIPRILCTRGARPAEIPATAGMGAVDAYLKATGQEGTTSSGMYAGSFRVRISRQRGGRTAIVIPNRNGADALRRLLESVEEYRAFEAYELIVADGDSRDMRTLRYYDILEKNRAAKIVRAQKTDWASLCNLGAAAAESEALLFLSRDAQVLTPDWLRALREQLGRPGVGAVGGKLMNAQRRILSAGSVAGLCGWWESPYAGEPDDTREVRKNRFINAIRQVSILPGACMMLSAGVFEELGGFDETIPNAGTDVELCMRLYRRGLACVYTPFAALLLHGALPRMEDAPTPAKMRCYDTLRPMLQKGDPFFSPHFDYDSAIPKVCAHPKPPLQCRTYDI